MLLSAGHRAGLRTGLGRRLCGLRGHLGRFGLGLGALGDQFRVVLGGVDRVPATPGQRWVPGRVARRDQQAAQYGKVLQEVDALLHALLLVVGLPEPVPGVGRGYQVHRNGERRQPREAADGQQRARDDLNRAAESDRRLDVVRYEGHPFGERPDHRFRSRYLPVWVQDGVQPLHDEDRGQHGTRGSSQYSHDRRMPRRGGSNPPAACHSARVLPARPRFRGYASGGSWRPGGGRVPPPGDGAVYWR